MKKISRPGRRRAGDNKDKILASAVILFAEHGYTACTFRMIAEHSGTNQGLLHYYFGSKQNLFCDVFEAWADVLVRRRMHLLDEAERRFPGGVPVETLVRCFVEPPLRMLQDDECQRAFIRIHARLRSDPVEFGLDLRRRVFGPSTRRFVEAMARACPHLSWEAVAWRFNWMVGSYLVVVTQGARIGDISEGRCSPDDIDAALSHLLPVLVAGFTAPDPDRDPPGVSGSGEQDAPAPEHTI